jgi:exoribonuclease-2
MGMAPTYDEKKLKEVRIFVEPVIKNLQNVKRNRIRYWTLKYLNQQQGEKYKALILDELKRRYRIVLTDLFLVAEIERRDGIILSPGEEILVQVKKADPWDDLLKLAYAE